ncbi:MAG TPA: alpha-2-macroglobulin family protein, partial [Vicinamibacteria bacterium]
DARFSAGGRFESTPRLEKDDVTSPEGGAKIALDPTLEPTAAPRSYVVEATVTGADDQTVTATRTIQALPPFVLGLKVPRYLERAKSIEGQMLMAGPDGELLAGRDVTVRLLRREWHSHLKASDFTDGVARYITDTVDVKVSETILKSGAEPLPLKLPIDRAGVYVVELQAPDRLGRAQTVSVDLYVGGDQPVAWPKPVTPVFSVALAEPRYDPGATASLILKSPFQAAHVLCIVEAPEGNRYSWLAVENGAATFRLPVEGHFTPRVPVHFILMRGRLPNTGPLPGNNTDLGKPASLAATAWVEVNPVAHQLQAGLKHPESARPGQKIDVTISLQDPKGQPLAGEVTLWLVDAAVLALGREQRLDPLPDFLTRVDSHLEVRDTRNLAFGALPFAENPGGDGSLEDSGLLDRATVRKNFKSVPYFNPAIQVGPGGLATVTVQLPDDLTNFKLRAKAASGPERFGVATSQLAVRLPVIVQPALPRFVRPGDRFTAAAVGRVVEGEGGAGTAEVRAEGVDLQGPARRELQLVANIPQRIEVPVIVKTPPRNADGQLAWTEVLFRMAVERTADAASDAFESKLPLREDRERVVKRVIEELKPGVPFRLPEVAEGSRPGTLRRRILLSQQPALVKMAAGLDFFRDYPYGCTEQQLSRARAYVAFRKFRALLGQKGGEKDVDKAVKDTLAFVPTAIDPNGLVAYWPGSPGYVSLTAWTVQFLVEAKAAGYAPDEKVLARLLRTLEQALRSDYSRFIDGESFAERVWALVALHQAGLANPAYAAELARKPQFLDLEGVAGVLNAFDGSAGAASTVASLSQTLSEGLVTRLFQGKEVYGGLQERRPSRNGLILPNETRTLAEVARAFARRDPRNAKLPLLTQALVTLGQ